MTNENTQLLISKKAAADLSGYQYRIISQDSDGKIEAVSASTEHPFGVLQNTPVTNEAGSVAPTGQGGITKIELGVTLATDAEISFDADGKAAPAIAGKYTVGVLTKGGAAGELGEALLSPASIKA